MPPSSDVLATATEAYRQGKITKTQYIAVIEALDEDAHPYTAWVEQKRREQGLSSLLKL